MFLWLDEKDNPTHKTPWIVYILCLINVIIFLLTYYSENFPEIIVDFGLVPSSPSLQNAVTSMFLHADYLHLISNIIFLWIFGDNVEDILGRSSFILCFIVCGLAGAYSHVAIASMSTIPMIGASGAISGLLGMYLCFFRYAHIDLEIHFLNTHWKTMHVDSMAAIFAWAGYQLFLGLLEIAFGLYMGLATWSHLGGLAAGLCLGSCFRLFGGGYAMHDRALKFERFHEAPVWCPTCGFKEHDRKFRIYKCSECGTKYEIIDKRPTDSDA